MDSVRRQANKLAKVHVQGALEWVNALWTSSAERILFHGLTLPGHRTSCFVSMGVQYCAPTSREGTAMKLGPGPKGA